MNDKFDDFLAKCAERIRNEGPDKLEEDLVSGRISLPHKVKAAKLALDRHRAQELGQYVLPLPPDPGLLVRLKTFCSNHWQWLIGTIIAVVGLYIAYLSI